MSRYIDADKLADGIKLSIKSWGRDCNSNAPKMVTAYQDVLYRVEAAPTADVVEVRHGEWQRWKNHPTIYGKDTLYVCSECTAKFLIESRYCAHCGAKMDGERREQNEG